MRWPTKYLPGLLLISLLLFVLTSRSFSARAIAFLEDQALTAAVSSLVLQGEFPLLGPPSHIGGRHLGPVLYYLEAALLLLADGDIAGAHLFGMLIKLLGYLAFGVWLVRGLPPSARSLGWLAVGCTLSAPLTIEILRTSWHSNWVPLFAFALLWSAERVRKTGLLGVPLFLLLASLSIQLHFSMAPLVLTAGAYGWFSRDVQQTSSLQKRPILSHSWIQFGLLTLSASSWLPALYYELNYPSLIFAPIFNHHQHERSHVGVYDALTTYADFFGDSIVTSAFYGKRAALAVAALLLPLTLLHHRLQLPSHLQRVAIIGGLATFVYVALVAQAPAPPYGYYFRALSFLPLAATVAVFALAQSLWLARIPMAFICLSTLYQLSHLFTEEPWTRVAPYHSLSHLQAVGNVLRDRIQPGEIVKVDTGGHAYWGRDGYLFFLGQPHWSQMRWHEVLHELPTMAQKATPLPTRRFAVTCPFPNKRDRKKIERELLSQSTVGPVDMTNCEAICHDCLVLEVNPHRPPPGSPTP